MRPGHLKIVLCTLSWGLIGSIVRHIDLPATVIVFFRLALGALVVLLYVTVRGHRDQLRPGARPWLLATSGVVLGVHWVSLFEAYQRIGVVTTILIVFTGPVLWAAASPFVLHERLHPAAIAGLGVAFVGITMISAPDIASLDLGGLLAAGGSAILFAVLVLMGKVLTQHYASSAITGWQLTVAAVLLAPALATASWEQVVRAAPGLLVLGTVMTGLLGIVFFEGLRTMPTQQLGVLFYLEPASAVFYAWWLAGERPAPLTLIGGALIVGAGLAIILLEHRVAPPGALPEPLTPEAPA